MYPQQQPPGYPQAYGQEAFTFPSAGAYIGPTMPGGPTPQELQTQNQIYSDGKTAPKKLKSKDGKEKKNLRMAGGRVWEDATLDEWPEDDYRIFVGDLGNEVSDEVLHKAFAHYSSLNKVKVVREKVTDKSKGYGFVSLQDPMEFLKCLKEMQGCYIGNRPCKIKKSNWKQRDLATRKRVEGKQATELIRLQSKATGTKKRRARPENSNRDALRSKKPAAAPPPGRYN